MTLGLCWGIFLSFHIGAIGATEQTPEKETPLYLEDNLEKQALDILIPRLINSIQDRQAKECFQKQEGIFQILSQVISWDMISATKTVGTVNDLYLRSLLVQEISNRASWEEDPTGREPFKQVLNQLIVDSGAIPDTVQKFKIMFNLSKARIDLESRGIGPSDFTMAREVALRLQDRSQRDQALDDIVQAHLKFLNTQGVSETISYISDASIKTQAYIQLAESELKMRQYESYQEIRQKALANIKMISNPRKKNMARYALAQVLLRAEELELALELVNAMNDKSYKDNTLWLIVMSQKREHPLIGLELVKRLSSPAKQIQASLDFAREYEKLGNILVTQNAVERAFETASSSDSDFKKNYFYSRQLPDIAKIQMQIGQKEGAIKTANMIPRVYDKYKNLVDLADIQLKRGDEEGAQDTLQAVLAGVDSLEPHQGRDGILLGLATGLAQSENLEESRRILQKALAFARNRKPLSQTVKAYQKIAQVQIDVGDALESQKTMQMMRKLIPSIFLVTEQIRAYQDLANLQSKAGFNDLAHDTLRQAFTLVSTLPQRPQKKSALQSLTNLQFEAFRSFKDLDFLKSVYDPMSKVVALITQADVYFKHQKKEKAREALEQAKKLGLSLEHVYDQSWVLSEIAKTQIYHHDIEGALDAAQSIKGSTDRALVLQEISAEVENKGQIGTILALLLNLPERVKVETLKNILQEFSYRVLPTAHIAFC